MESTTVQDAAILGTLEMGTVNVRVHVCVLNKSHPSVKKRPRCYTQSSTVQGRNISTYTSPYQKLY